MCIFVVCSAVMNAVINGKTTNFNGCSIYVSQFPCNESAKVIIQAGIKEVVYCNHKYQRDEKNIASKRMFDIAGVKYRYELVYVMIRLKHLFTTVCEQLYGV